MTYRQVLLFFFIAVAIYSVLRRMVILCNYTLPIALVICFIFYFVCMCAVIFELHEVVYVCFSEKVSPMLFLDSFTHQKSHCSLFLIIFVSAVGQSRFMTSGKL